MPHVDDGTLHAYLDGELSPPEAQGVEAHVAQCAGCRTRLEEERALITRAAELLGRAAPPDRELPPFRAGGVAPPVLLWWQVRLPLAWAATVALALGIGIYLGPAVGSGPEPEARADSNSAIRQEPQAAPVTRDLAHRAPRATRRSTVRTPPAEQPAVPAPAVETDQLGGRPAEAQPPTAPAPGYPRSERAAAPENKGVALKTAPRRYALRGPPIDADSARLVLGTDPLVVPDLPVRGIYRAHLPGYSAVVIVEQTLDSSTVIEVINGRPAAVALSPVLVTGAGAQADTMSVGARALLGRSADSVAQVARKRVAAPPAALRADQSVAGLLLEIRGPLSADSLAALRRRLRPLRP